MEKEKIKGEAQTGLFASIRSGIERRKGDTGAVIFDAVVFAIGFLFARCHLVFGSYPLACAFVAVLPRGVWVSLLGAVLGSLSLGKAGVIHAVISVIVVFLRIVISGGKNESTRLFCEPLILKIASAATGSFVGAVYELLLNEFGLTSVLYGLSAVILSAVFTFCFSGIFDGGISFEDMLFGSRDIFAHRKNEAERFGLYLFQGAFLIFVFTVSLSLSGYDFLGISPVYIFASLITLYTAKRFGAIRAMAVGFAASLGVSWANSVGFALLGLASGILFPINIIYALGAGGALLCGWGFYSGELVGLLSLLPEYSAAALCAAPLLRRLKSCNGSSAVTDIDEKGEASSMVATTALGYKSSGAFGLSRLQDALVGMSGALRTFGAGEGNVLYSEYRDTVTDCVREFCPDCPYYGACITITPAPCVENADLIATKLYKKERLFPDDAEVVPRYCKNGGALVGAISEASSKLEGDKFKDRRMDGYAEECELFSRLLLESCAAGERECAVDGALSEKLSEVFLASGIRSGVIRALGSRRKYFIGAGEDKDGRIITSPELKAAMEAVSGVKLGTPEFYRKGDIALFECPSAPSYSVEFAAAGAPASTDEVSGDTAISFESGDGYFYSLISDGMGRGDIARRTSVFTADFLSRILTSPCSKGTALHFLNRMIRGKGEECSATVDLFEFDLLSGEGVFYKCGAAPSFVKRDGSIFRIRSETAPVGIMQTIDAERIRVEVKSGDYIVMLSDGVAQTAEDSVWLLELLNKPPHTDIRAYAELILAAAKENSRYHDDMSVCVLRIQKLGEGKASVAS